MKTSQESHPAKTFRYYCSIIIINILILTCILAAMEFTSSRLVEKPANEIISHWRLNHIWRPNYRSLHKEWIKNNPDFPKPFTLLFNKQSWIESYDVKKKKPAGTYRIFYVGDSFTQGTAPMDQSVPSIVEDFLNKNYAPEGIKFEVINTGTSSFSPMLYYILIRYKIMSYSPDLIVVNVDMTDVFDDWKYRQTAIFDDSGNPWAVPPRNIYSSTFLDTELGAVKATFWNRMQLFLYRNSNFYNLLLKYYAKKESRTQKTPVNKPIHYRWMWCQHEWNAETMENVRFSMDILNRLAVFCKGNNVKLMVTSVPYYLQYNGDTDGSGSPAYSSRPHEAVSAAAQKNDIPYLNSFKKLQPVITGSPQPEYYYYHDMHFNPRGYALWAKAHLDFLMDKHNKLLPESVYQAD